MPDFGPMAWKLSRRSDVLLHGSTRRGWRCAAVCCASRSLTYHCDLQFAGGPVQQGCGSRSAVPEQGSRPPGWRRRDVYPRLRHTLAYLSQYVDHKLVIVPPPITLNPVTDAAVRAFRKARRGRPAGHRHIGRLAAEKGVEVCCKLCPRHRRLSRRSRSPRRATQNILGEEAYAARLAALRAIGAHYKLRARYRAKG